MSEKNLLLALDIGTTKVCSIIGNVEKGEIEILGVGSHPSHGLKKGSVINIDKTVQSISCSLEEAKLMSGISNIRHATIGIAGNHIYSFNSSGVVGVKNKEILAEDVERVVDAAKAVMIPSDREVLHIIAQDFKVDNVKGIKDPVGMCGVRLEGHVHIVTGHTSSIQNLVKCVEQVGLSVDNILLQPIASSRSVLSPEEKEMGVVLVDIGGGTTDIAIWKEGGLVHSQIIPVGGNHFTNDLAVALKVPHNEAERIKINHGSVLAEAVEAQTQIEIQGLSHTKRRQVPLQFIARILGARAEELFQLIDDVVHDYCQEVELNGGYVLTGGGALIRDIITLGEYTLNVPCKIGFPQSVGRMTNVMKDPKFSTVLGLMQESVAHVAEDHKVEESRDSDIIKQLGLSLRNAFKEIF